ncbi:unnamed protein product [Cercospora beticola]|nr:unnamed protein product [Cercospora beticola]
MAALESIRARFESLSKSAFVDVNLPRFSDVDVATLIRDGKATEIGRIPARRNLFFDEQANILIVLKTTIKESEVRDILPYLDLILAAHATDAVPQGGGNTASASGKHDLNSRTLAADGFDDLVVTEEHTYVIWKQQLHLSRPRARLQRPAIYFTANLRIAEQLHSGSQRPKEQLLKPFEPLPANVLESLAFSRAPGAADIYISESRITKVAPKPPNLTDTVKPIRGASRRAFPAVPAVFTRIRYSTLPDAIIASLHLETSHVIAGTTTIHKADLNVTNADVKDLTNVALPLEARGADETVLLYKVTPHTQAHAERNSLAESPVSISVRAEALLDQGSRISLEIDWQAHIDLTHTWQKPHYRWSRAAGHSSYHKKSLSAHSITRPSMDTTSGASTDRTEHTSNGGSIVFNFHAASTTYESSEFKISVHCNNRSTRAKKFGLMMLHPRSSTTTKPRPTTGHTTIAAATIDGSTTSDLLASLFNAPALEKAKPPDVLDLNPDARIGPLPPGACFETHMPFKALRSGVLDLGVLRIIDLDTRQTVDVRELPDVIALGRIESERG